MFAFSLFTLLAILMIHFVMYYQLVLTSPYRSKSGDDMLIAAFLAIPFIGTTAMIYGWVTYEL